MTFTWCEHVDALDEYRAAAQWYQSKLPVGATSSWTLSMSRSRASSTRRSAGAFTVIGSAPRSFTPAASGFPLDIVYLRIDDEIYVVAYAHERRRPGYWAQRLSD